MLVDNRTTRLGNDNPAALAELLAELAATDKGLIGTAFSGDDLDLLIADLAGTPQEVPSFREYDEAIADEVKMCTCPDCGHKFPA